MKKTIIFEGRKDFDLLKNLLDDYLWGVEQKGKVFEFCVQFNINNPKELNDRIFDLTKNERPSLFLLVQLYAEIVNDDILSVLYSLLHREFWDDVADGIKKRNKKRKEQRGVNELV